MRADYCLSTSEWVPMAAVGEIDYLRRTEERTWAGVPCSLVVTLMTGVVMLLLTVGVALWQHATGEPAAGAQIAGAEVLLATTTAAYCRRQGAHCAAAPVQLPAASALSERAVAVQALQWLPAMLHEAAA